MVIIRFNQKCIQEAMFNSFIFIPKVECNTNYFNQASPPLNDSIREQLHIIPPSDISLLKYPLLVFKNNIDEKRDPKMDFDIAASTPGFLVPYYECYPS